MVSQYYWVCKSGKNIVTHINGKQVNLSMLIYHTKCKYLNGNISDCRSNNIITIVSQKGLKKFRINGYIGIYMPEHHRASKVNGCVYEHILVAEKMLGRLLLPTEVVHHIDKDRSNNSPENLMVFSTRNDHIAYHAGAEAILQDNGSYKCQVVKVIYKYKNILSTEDTKEESVEIINIKNKDICPECMKRLKSKDAKRCLECNKKYNRRNFPPKEELEQYIGKLSFVKIGEIYGVTDNSIRRWCKFYGLPYKKNSLNT